MEKVVSLKESWLILIWRGRAPSAGESKTGCFHYMFCSIHHFPSPCQISMFLNTFQRPFKWYTQFISWLLLQAYTKVLTSFFFLLVNSPHCIIFHVAHRALVKNHLVLNVCRKKQQMTQKNKIKTVGSSVSKRHVLDVVKQVFLFIRNILSRKFLLLWVFKALIRFNVLSYKDPAGETKGVD